MKSDRRTFLNSSLALAMGLAAGCGNDAAVSSSPIANTRHGPVEGRLEEGVYAFKGVRYGADTGGRGRFMPPRPSQPWTDPAPALEYGPACPQSRPASGREMPEGESEDCLHLNVWTRGLRDGKKRPVMVWLHGGGLWRLSAAGAWQAGRNLSARGDVVMVSPNHRISVLGFSHFGDINPDYEGSSHAGMLDLILALKWVQENIEEFGGDPDNVTIFGQSGGGQKVSLLMAMPAAKGLFHKAVIQSGPMPLTLERAYANDLASRFLARLDNPGADADALAQAPLSDVMKAYYETFDEIGGFGVMGIVQDVAPVVDGDILPQQPFWNSAPDVSKDIPLIIGSTRTEMTEYNLMEDPDAAGMDFSGAATRLRSIFGDDAEKILARYRENHPDASAWEVYALIRSDWPTRLFSLHIADRKLEQGGAPVFVYRTDWETQDRDGLLMAPHAIDIQFVLDTADATEPLGLQAAERKIMTEYMSGAWLSFARNGAPKAPGGPDWPQYSLPSRPTFIFDLECRIENDPDGDDIAILRENASRYRLGAGGINQD